MLFNILDVFSGKNPNLMPEIAHAMHIETVEYHFRLELGVNDYVKDEKKKHLTDEEWLDEREEKRMYWKNKR